MVTPRIELFFRLAAWLLAFSLMSEAPVLAGAATVRATVNKQEIASVEPLALTVSVEGDSGQVDVAPIEQEGAFRVGSRSSSTNISIMGGAVNRVSEYTFHLFPLREGELRIPPLPVKVDGQTLMTEAIPVRVRPAGSGRQTGAGSPPGGLFPHGPPPSSPQQPTQQAQPAPEGDEVFLESELSKPEAWVGESVFYTLKIYVGAHIANGRIEMPDFSGFTSKELERKEYMTVVNGRQYEVTEAQFLLTPLKAGEASFGPPALNCDLVRRSRWNTRSVFDQFFNNPFFKMDPLMPAAELEPRSFRGRPLTLKVNALPPLQGPGEFTGLIGSFSLSAALDKSSLEAGESATLSLTLEGTGNVQDAAEPKLTLPPTLKIYKDAPQLEVKMGAAGYVGKKVFKYALVPLEPGPLHAPEASLVYFDVRSKNYATARAQIPALAVRPPARQERTVVSGPAPQTAAGLIAQSAPGVATGQKVEFRHKDALPLKEELTALRGQSPLSAPIFWLLAGGPPALFGLTLLARRVGRREKSLAATLSARSEAAFKEAETLLRDAPSSPNAVLTACGKGLLAAVCAKAGKHAETLTYAEAEQYLAEQRAPEELRRRVVELMRRVDALRYGGTAQNTAADATGCNAALSALLVEARDAVRSLRS